MCWTLWLDGAVKMADWKDVLQVLSGVQSDLFHGHRGP